jgi:hypothetical protein
MDPVVARLGCQSCSSDAAVVAALGIVDNLADDTAAEAGRRRIDQVHHTAAGRHYMVALKRKYRRRLMNRIVKQHKLQAI